MPLVINPTIEIDNPFHQNGLMLTIHKSSWGDILLSIRKYVSKIVGCHRLLLNKNSKIGLL
jgi:hypothetical protein